MSANMTETASESIWLSHLTIRNFRSCKETEVKFQPGVTLLVGENNAGKSNIVDAIRLGLDPLSGRATRYFETEDLTEGATDPIDIDLEFKDATDFQKALFINGLVLESGTIQYQTSYLPPTQEIPRGKRVRTAGKPRGADSDFEARAKINCVYVEPLRDAKYQLASGNGRRLGTILNALLSEQEKRDFEQDAKDAFGKLSSEGPISTVNNKIQSHLTALTHPIRSQTVEVNFETPKLEKLARSLRMKMAEKGIDPRELDSSGLGYANLLFLSTVLLELSVVRESELTILLIEEPEAHLHPQLQGVLLDFLRSATKGEFDDTAGVSIGGRLQVIATTHSPSIASAVGVNEIVVVKSDKDSGTYAIDLQGVDFGTGKTRANSIRKINQYLDATRSELLFARQVILVEGISEAVLLPAIAERVLDKDPQRLRKFKACTTIIVGSVDFGPYIKLLTHSSSNQQSIVEKLVLLTDEDPNMGESANSVTRGSECEGNDRFRRVVSPWTLEVSLLGDANENGDLLKIAYLQQRSRSEARWNKISAGENPQHKMYTMMGNNQSAGESLNIQKGQFAHDLAILLRERKPNGSFKNEFKCPEHLAQLINFITCE
ncbi:AAA family ATPase [Corynebacterium belfantii]|uniref:ATP-dependent nuclease n=1 Tax=Corynebacterium belfantii TaxID=2014537 RepID=UPI0018D41907|nr:AAA family ATPase [Corynebacterium belfantii]MBG9329243.1 AAA family ATPase [Corynebacterium belfantii]